MRAITAAGAVASVTAGSTRCDSAERHAPVSALSAASISIDPVSGATSNCSAMRPATGSASVLPHSRRPTAKNMISSSPHQNTGIELPTSAAPVTSLSGQCPCRAAAQTPAGTPSANASTNAASASSSVAGKRSMNSLHTGAWLAMLEPRSRCSARHR